MLTSGVVACFQGQIDYTSSSTYQTVGIVVACFQGQIDYTSKNPLVGRTVEENFIVFGITIPDFGLPDILSSRQDQGRRTICFGWHRQG